jgi:dipeptidyl aminopeptidase/acylaminoacyl peptidase
MLADRDIRQTPLYGKVREYYERITVPAQDKVTDAADVTVSSDGNFAAFTGTVHNDVASSPVTRVCIVDLGSGSIRRIAAGNGSDRLPRWSPDAKHLAFLSDRAETGNFQLLLCHGDGHGPCHAVAAVDGVIESLQWSPNGRRILLVVAGFGADLAGCQGGATTLRKSQDAALPAWTPEVDTGDAENLWRRVYLYDVERDAMSVLSTSGINCWEATWLGDEHVVVVSSRSHSEGSWYQSQLTCLGVSEPTARMLYQPRDQIGVPVGSPSGRRLALIEAVCSDRMIVAGDLLLMDVRQGAVKRVDTRAVDVTQVGWRDDRHLVFVGHRGLETVVGEVDTGTGELSERWASLERTFGAWYPAMWPMPGGGCAVIGEGYDVAPELAVIDGGGYRMIASLDARGAGGRGPRTSIEPVYWKARDGREIQGWVVKPPGAGPFPLVMDIHGGPVWACRNRWQGRLRGTQVLTEHGVAVFYPNPRGSGGRGLEFARLVVGDMGGEDTFDYLTGIDALVENGVADARRLGVTGISYGGFMSAWLITQDSRFAAAAPISCVSDWYSQHRTSQIPHFDELFLAGSASDPNGHFFQRSPAMHTRHVRTPTLQLTGARDQNTPPTQALEFHRSLLEHGARSILVTYPTAGHGIRGFPEVIDATTRYV